MSSKNRKNGKNAASNSVDLKNGTDKKIAVQPAQWQLPDARKDDLQMIKGIGLPTEIALNNINIRRFVDFKGKTAGQISEMLQNKQGVAITAEDISKNKWIEQAIELAEQFGEEQPAALQHEEITELAGQEISASAEKGKAQKANKSGTARTTKRVKEAVDNKAANLSQKAKPGKSEKQPRREVSKVVQKEVQVSAPQQEVPASAADEYSPPPERSMEKSPDTTKPTVSKEATVTKKQALKIKQVQFDQVQSQEDGKTFLQSEIDLGTDGIAAGTDDPKTAIHVQIHANERLTGKNYIIASDSLSLTDKSELRVRLRCSTLAIGYYDLRVVAFPFEKRANVALFNGPSLKIEP